MEKIVIFDVDGVLLDLWGPMKHAYDCFIGRTLSEREWIQIIINFNRNYEPFREFGNYFQALDIYDKLEPMPGMQWLVSNLHQQGITMAIITAADPEEKVMSKRLDNLKKHFGDVFKEVVFVGKACKSDELRRLSAGYDRSFFFDDNVKNIVNCISAVSDPVWVENEPGMVDRHLLDLSVVKTASHAVDMSRIIY